MNKFKLNATFKKVKERAGLDYAVPTPDEYGDCNTCVNDKLADVFGLTSTGIYAKHWVTGMNAGGPWKYLNEVYIGHDITEEQAEILIEVFKENGYEISPETYDPHKAFCIKESLVEPSPMFPMRVDLRR